MEKSLEQSINEFEDVDTDLKPSAEMDKTVVRSKIRNQEYIIHQNSIENFSPGYDKANSTLYDSTAFDFDTNKSELRKIKKFSSSLNIIGEEVENYNNLLNTLEHSNILKHHELILNEESNNKKNLNLVMENWEINLVTILSKEKVSNKNLVKYIKQIVSGLQYLHSKNILHLNLCSENLLIKSETIKIAQFGLSKFSSNDFNPLYTAPEILKGNCPSFSSDIFSLANIIFYMYYKTTPLEIFNPEVLKNLDNYEFIVSEIERAERENFDFFKPKNEMPARIKKIVKEGLSINEKMRGELEQILNELENEETSIEITPDCRSKVYISNDKKYEYYISDISLGKGSYGQVYKGIRREVKKDFNEYIAAKEIAFSENEEFREFDLAKGLNHDNAVKNYDLINIESNSAEQKYLIILELCDCDLKTYLKNELSEDDIIGLMKQMFFAIKYLHSQNIIHRDIKPENILMKNEVLKITDFGTSKRLLEENLYSKTFRGTPLYTSPEILQAHGCTFSADIFSMGVTFFYLFFKKTPWEIIDPKIKNVSHPTLLNNTIKEFNDKMNDKSFDPFYDPNIKIPPSIRKLILKCLKLDASVRPSLSEIEEILFEGDIKNVDDRKSDHKIKLLNLISNRYKFEYENLVFEYQIIQRLTNLIDHSMINGPENLALVIFMLTKSNLILATHIYKSLRRKTNIFSFKTNIWEEFCKERNYKLLLINFSEFRVKVHESFKAFENIKNPYIEKYFDSNLNKPEDFEFHLTLQKSIVKFIDENMTESFKPRNKYYLLYVALYGLIVLLTRRKSLEFKNDKNRNIFCFEDLMKDEGKMKIVFNRINQAITLFDIFSNPSV